MSSQPLPPEIADAIRRLDAAIATTGWSESLAADWKKVRGYCRSKHSESQRVLPAASLVSQEIAQSRNHAQAALDAMAAVFGKREDEPKRDDDEDLPDTVKIRRPPPEDGGE